MFRAGPVFLLLLLLAGAAVAGSIRLKHLLDPEHEDFPLAAYAWPDWEDLDKATKLRAKGTDPAEWEDPPPWPETEEERKEREAREAEEEEERKAHPGPPRYPQDRVPGFRFDDRLERKKKAFEELIQPASPSKLEGFVKQIDEIDKALARYDRKVDETREDYTQLKGQLIKAQEAYVENYRRRNDGKYPETVPVSGSLLQSYNRTSLLLQHQLAVRQSEVQFHDWMLSRIGQLIGELTPEEAERPLRALKRGLRDRDWMVRIRCGRLLAHVPGEGASALFREAMDEEEDPLVLAELLRIRRLRGGDGVLEALAARLDDERWPVCAAAIRELANLGRKEAIDLLVEHMGKQDGRLLDDFAAALRRVTGQRYRSEPEAWKVWWRKARPTWVPPQEATPGDEPGEGQEKGVVYFYGIQSHSKRVVFCIDVSGSMGFPLDGQDGKEAPRIETAKRELLQALNALPEDARFALVVYSSDVRVWKRRMQPATLRNKEAARKFVDQLEPEGATNIFDALATSLEVAGADDKRKDDEAPEADTIFFLTDGQPTHGEIVDPFQILEEITRRNATIGIRIHAVGVSEEQNRAFLLNLAKRNGGRYVGYK